MAGKASVALFLAVNMVVFAMASACGGNCPKPTPSTPTPTPASYGKCPRDTLKLGVCANVLGLIKAKVGVPPAEPCCPLLEGLVDLEAAVCLCTAIKGKILGINLSLPTLGPRVAPRATRAAAPPPSPNPAPIFSSSPPLELASGSPHGRDDNGGGAIFNR